MVRAEIKIEPAGMETHGMEFLNRLIKSPVLRDQYVTNKLESIKPLQSLDFYQSARISPGYFESPILLHSNLLYLLKTNPGAIIPFIFNKTLLTLIKANPSLINVIFSQARAISKFAYSSALIEELASNPRLLSALTSNSNLQEARRMLSVFMPYKHSLFYSDINKKHLLLTERLLKEKIFSIKKSDSDNLLVRAWRTKINADIARDRIANILREASLRKSIIPIDKTRVALYGHPVEDEIVTKALKAHYEKIVTPFAIHKMESKALITTTKGPLSAQQFYDPNKFPNINPAYLAIAGSGGAITVKGRKVADEEEAYIDEHTYKEKIKENEDVNKIIEVLFSKIIR